MEQSSLLLFFFFCCLFQGRRDIPGVGEGEWGLNPSACGITRLQFTTFAMASSTKWGVAYDPPINQTD